MMMNERVLCAHTLSNTHEREQILLICPVFVLNVVPLNFDLNLKHFTESFVFLAVLLAGDITWKKEVMND